jgi:hypothetical protein
MLWCPWDSPKRAEEVCLMVLMVMSVGRSNDERQFWKQKYFCMNVASLNSHSGCERQLVSWVLSEETRKKALFRIPCRYSCCRRGVRWENLLNLWMGCLMLERSLEFSELISGKAFVISGIFYSREYLDCCLPSDDTVLSAGGLQYSELRNLLVW